MTEPPDRDIDDVVTITEAGITVEKQFTTDEFPVPAVKFVLSSAADEPVEVRLTDEIPETVEMESIGFHPDYEGDAWAAYRDHRVEYERTVDPGEEVTTVYGVRIDDPSAGAKFLGEPRLERVAEAGSPEDPEEILGRETTGAVRDALAGDGELAADADGADEVAVDLDEPDDLDLSLDEPGGAEAEAAEEGLELDEPGGAEAEAAEEAPGPGEIELGEPEADDADEPPAPRSMDPDLTPAVTAGAAADADGQPADAGDADDAAGAEPAAPGALPGNVAAALAAEIRDGAADEDDLAVLREAVAPEGEPEIPTSVEVRIDRLQNRTEDLAAYTDALEAFLDEEGTGQELLDDLDDRTAALREDLDEVASETADLDGTVADHDDRLADVEATADDLTDDVASLEEGLDDLGSRVEDLEADLDDLAGDAEASVDDLRETLDDVEATMADIEDEIEDLQSFRDRMREAFGS